MRCERLALGGADDATGVAAEIRKLVPPPESVRDGVALIIATVRAGGDRAVRDYSRTLDTGGREPQALLVRDDELDAAVAALDPAVRLGIERAIRNVEAVAAAWGSGRPEVVVLGENRVILRRAPVDRAAVYVPGGRAPYPSTVVMGAVPARLAGVAHIAVCSPPRSDGDLDPVVLAACRLAGVDTVYRMGGAHAIAALAYGTESVARRRRDRRPREPVRPGGEAAGFRTGRHRRLCRSERPADPRHRRRRSRAARARSARAGRARPRDTGGRGIGQPPAARRLRGAPAPGSRHRRGRLRPRCLRPRRRRSRSPQAFAPEHLQLVGTDAEALADRATTAGCLFVGAGAGTAFGDYIAGSNHILPTNGAARFASGRLPRALPSGASARCISRHPRSSRSSPHRSPAPRASSCMRGRWKLAFGRMGAR